MSLLMQHKEADCLWGVWKMDETLPELYQALADEVLCLEAEQRFTALHRRQEWLSVRLLLFRLLGEKKEIAYHESGKPYLADGSYHLSISHTKGYVAVILGISPVGIDIEQYGRRVHKVAGKYMGDGEEAVPYQGDDTWSLLLHWSAKEVMFKCMDSAGVDFRRHLHISPFTPGERGSFRAYENKTEQQRNFDIRYLLHPDFVLTWQVD